MPQNATIPNTKNNAMTGMTGILSFVFGDVAYDVLLPALVLVFAFEPVDTLLPPLLPVLVFTLGLVLVFAPGFVFVFVPEFPPVVPELPPASS